MMLRSLLTFKTIKAKAIVNDTTALAEALESNNKVLVSLLLKSENTDYSQEEINKAFIKADNINSPTVTAFLDDYFEQIIAFPEDIERDLERNTAILELLQKEPYRNYLFHKLINYIDRTDQEEKLSLLRTMISTNETKDPKHPFFQILSICSPSTQLSISPLFVTPILQLDTLKQLYIELQAENRKSLSR